jgi:hypothetical protein
MKPTRTADTFALALICVGLASCAGPEPDFQTASLSESTEAVPYDPEPETMDFDELRAAGLGAMISDELPAPAFDPREVHYPELRADRNLLVALHSGVPRLVDVTGVEPREHEALLSAVDVDSGERLSPPRRTTLSPERARWRSAVDCATHSIRSAFSCGSGTTACSPRHSLRRSTPPGFAALVLLA